MAYPLLTLATALGMMTFCWLVSIRLRDVGIVDILWAPAFAIIAWLCALDAPAIGLRGWLVLGLVNIWALRLGGHVLRRWLKLGHEDYRYSAIRRKHGTNFPLTSLFWIFWLQGVLLWVISWPLQVVPVSTKPLNWLDVAGCAVALAGIVIEAVADQQLTRFPSVCENREKVLDKGLWAWSRHPNYFGDFLLWWGFWLIALAGGGPWWIITGPIAMSALLLHYSGIGLMEDTIVERRQDYRDYIRRTSAFVPLPNFARLLGGSKFRRW